MDKERFMTPIRYKIEEVLPKLVRKYSPKKPEVIDFGCGRGMYSKLFKRFNKFKYEGIDLDKKEEWKDFSSENVNYSAQDGTKLNFKDEKFNFAIAITSLEHIEDEKQAISELYRVVKKNSNVIIIVPTRPYWLFQLGRHCFHHNSKKQLIRLVKSKPFKIIKYKKIGGPLSFLFTWADIWVSQAIVLPFWLIKKVQGKKLESKTIWNILDNTIHLYMKFRFTRAIYHSILKFISVFDNVFRIIPNHQLIILKK